MSKRKRNLIFHHNDLDGYMSMAIVKRFCEGVLDEVVVTIECDHAGHSLQQYVGKSSVWLDPFDVVWVLDLGIAEGTSSIYKTLQEKFGSNFIWIDHHLTSYEYAKKSIDNIIEGEVIKNGSGEPEIRVGCAIDGVPKSATELTLSYIIDDCYIPYCEANTTKKKKFVNTFDQIVNGNDAGKRRASKIFKLVGIWDTFQTDHPFFNDARMFMLGSQMHCVPNDDYWMMFVGDVDTALDKLSWAIQIGEAISAREDIINTNAMNKNAFVARIPLPEPTKDILDGDESIIKMLDTGSGMIFVDALCVNKIGGSATFGKYAYEFPILLSYIDMADSDTVKFSIYSDMPANLTGGVSVNAGKFATAVNKTGGGHKGAAGFIADTSYRDDIHDEYSVGMGPDEFLKKYTPTIGNDPYPLLKQNK